MLKNLIKNLKQFFAFALLFCFRFRLFFLQGAIKTLATLAAEAEAAEAAAGKIKELSLKTMFQELPQFMQTAKAAAIAGF